jgi:hypothetical protein
MNVLHRCDIPACVNPAHLFLGTQKDNALDMVAKGRDEQGGRKLEPEMILAIRRSPLKQAELARQFFVSRVTISDIRRRKSWKHLS